MTLLKKETKLKKTFIQQSSYPKHFINILCFNKNNTNKYFWKENKLYSKLLDKISKE